VAALREGTRLIVQLSTGGAVTDSFASRLAVLDAAPDACSLTCGTVNFGDDVFSIPWPFIKDLYQLTRECQVVPEFELFDLGYVATLDRLLDQFGPPAGGHVHCDLVMGVPGGMPGDVATLAAAVAALPAAARRSPGTGTQGGDEAGAPAEGNSGRSGPGRPGSRGRGERNLIRHVSAS
jgi:3-keto-5-aminohexanoate cleavage enzyme